MYRNDAFHLSVSYPEGWQVNVTPASQTSPGIPLHMVITRTGTLQSDSTLVTNWSLTILNGSDKNIADQIKLLRDRIKNKDASLHAMTLAGMTAYQEPTAKQAIPGSQITDTHSVYHLLVNDLDYDISTDALSSDHAGAALQSIMASFTLLK